MTIQTNPFVIGSQNWTYALRVSMGYPDYAPAFHTTAWTSSGRPDIFQGLDVARLAAEMARDVVHVTMESDGSEPLRVSLAVRDGVSIAWLPNVRLYAASETSRIELLSHDRRWFVGPRLVLTRAKLPPKSQRERGEQIAKRRWRQAFETMNDLELAGNLFVPEGGGYADAIRHEDLKLAA